MLILFERRLFHLERSSRGGRKEGGSLGGYGSNRFSSGDEGTDNFRRGGRGGGGGGRGGGSSWSSDGSRTGGSSWSSGGSRSGGSDWLIGDRQTSRFSSSGNRDRLLVDGVVEVGTIVALAKGCGCRRLAVASDATCRCAFSHVKKSRKIGVSLPVASLKVKWVKM
ncbi:hypothetical protein Tco_0756884 [Tanacetum coccineum]